MGNIIAYVAFSITWCFCTAATSLCSACLGSDKTSSDAPTVNSGRKRSVFLLVIAIGLAFAFQYGVAPALAPDGSAVTKLPKVGQYLVDSWNDGCAGYGSDELQMECSGNAGAFRASASATLFFLLAAVAAACKPTANRDAWFAKYILFLFLAAGTVFIPNQPVFLDIYLNIARVGGIIFIIIQQIILIDLAYNWNDSWVLKADEADLEERGSGKKWLTAILVSCGILFFGSIAVIGLLYTYFRGCPTNEAFISVTLIMSIIITIVQLSGEESSLLTSAVITAYATYLALTAVTKNPNGECNPNLGSNDVLGIFLGIGFTIISLAWTGWSYTADKKLTNTRTESHSMSNSLVDNDHEGHTTTGKTRKSAVKGMVTNNDENEDYGATNEQNSLNQNDNNEVPAQTWKMNLVLAMISCWFGMALTGWGSIEKAGTVANPTLSNVSMWMIISSQWLVFSLYLWTLVAPRILTDRDFS